jgi:chaperonin GroES
MNVIPLGERLIVRRNEAATHTPGGLALPSRAQDRPQSGVVLAVGPGRLSAAQKLSRLSQAARALLDALKRNQNDQQPSVVAEFEAVEAALNATATPMRIKPGDTVMFGKFAGNEIVVDGEKVLMLAEGDVLAIVEPAEVTT